ncbi:MAG TPA: SUMF1/EgtB/PvdO family nonheme iron enzyme, partial [Saprospiraceae bacterium]|nr:SUMF1/EgtB/PvdO family nonheme iron enzyme [Saprospiraceae bacterium]
MARRFTPLLLFVLPLLSLPLSNGTGASALLVMAPKQPFTVVEVLIPGGTFQMGTNEGYAEEAPAHQVTLDSFYLGRYEVTVAEFKAFVKATGYKTDAEKAGHSTVAFGLSWE